MSMTDLGGVKHACSKTEFNRCEDKFQKHVRAVSEYKYEDKQELWCQVLEVS